LGEHFSTLMPRIIAAEPDRRWFLMAACRGQRLEEIGDVTVWERAASRYARLQIDCIERVGALRSLGCPLRDLEALARSIAALAADTDALRPGQSEGLTESEFGHFRQWFRSFGNAATSSHGAVFPIRSSTEICGPATSTATRRRARSSTGKTRSSHIRSSASHR
jgi:hypothetical protein